ncbi:hypothetical protein [Bacillus thuringiensis]|uniref:hypothetical protein n=1 Tax=Bacillus thuringiensis TaxID=1428 RepID=UPI00333CD729
MDKQRKDKEDKENIIKMIRDLRAKGIDTTVIESAHCIIALDEKAKGEMKMKEQETISSDPRELRNAYLREWRKKNKEKVKKYQDRYWEKKAKEMHEQQ